MHTHKFKSSNSCRMHTHAKTIKLYTDLWKWPSSVVVALAWSLGFHILETDSLRFGSNSIIYVFPPGSGFFVWGPFFMSSLSRQLIACFRATRGHYGKQHIYMTLKSACFIYLALVVVVFLLRIGFVYIYCSSLFFASDDRMVQYMRGWYGYWMFVFANIHVFILEPILDIMRVCASEIWVAIIICVY